MIVVISGSNRPGSVALKVSRVVENLIKEKNQEVFFINLQELPPALFEPKSYKDKPVGWAPYQKAIFEAQGIISVIPEYNGSFPGVYKYFIDMLQFPESLVDTPSAFVGLAAGEWGGLRTVEQAEMVFQYRSAHLYGKRVFLKFVSKLFDASGNIQDPKIQERLTKMIHGFLDFCQRVRPASPITQ